MKRLTANTLSALTDAELMQRIGRGEHKAFDTLYYRYARRLGGFFLRMLAYDTAKANGKCFMIAQVLRWWPEYVYLKDSIDTGRYGKLVSGTMTRIGAIPVRSWDN